MTTHSAEYAAVAKSLNHSGHYVGVQARAADSGPPARSAAALVVQFMDKVEPPLLAALVSELTRRLRRRSRGQREAVILDPDGKLVRRVPLNS